MAPLLVRRKVKRINWDRLMPRRKKQGNAKGERKSRKLIQVDIADPSWPAATQWTDIEEWQ